MTRTYFRTIFRIRTSISVSVSTESINLDHLPVTEFYYFALTEKFWHDEERLERNYQDQDHPDDTGTGITEISNLLESLKQMLKLNTESGLGIIDFNLVTEKFVRLMFLMLKLQSLNKSNS